MEFVIGGLAGAGATITSNPFDVVKIRLQLQGELEKYNEQKRSYRGVFHALYVIATKEGIKALYKGLVPALALGFSMNAFRLGIYQVAMENGWTRSSSGELSMVRAAATAAFSGWCGTVFSSPAFLIKIRLQSFSHPSIAVGRQFQYKGSMSAIREIYRKEGLSGFWAGCMAGGARVAVGSAAQLATFTKSLELLKKNEFLAESKLLMAFLASCVSGLAVVIVSCPLDVASVRLYNQGDRDLYSGLLDCLRKIYVTEGFRGLYKGLGPFYLRLAPHNMVSLLIWDSLTRAQKHQHHNER